MARGTEEIFAVQLSQAEHELETLKAKVRLYLELEGMAWKDDGGFTAKYEDEQEKVRDEIEELTK